MSSAPPKTQAPAATGKADKKKGPSALTKAYLVFYNVASMVGWGLVAKEVFTALIAGKTAAQMSTTALPLVKIVQTTAALEILHSIFRIVPSAWFTTFIQVMSRLIVLWAYTVPTSYSHWSLYLLFGSWSLSEIPRYALYVWQLLFPTSAAPYPLFWLRYSLFAVLYPTGITGEILQLWTALPFLKAHYPIARIISYIVLFALYPPGSPFMYLHMVGMRRSQFKKRREAGAPKPPAPQGLVFPTDAATGEVSTTNTGKAVFAASVAGVVKAAADAVNNTKNWRFGYAKQVVEHVKIASESPKTAVAVAEAGLAACYDTFRFVRASADFDGTLAEALKHFTGSFELGTVKGSAAKPAAGYELQVPYQGGVLTGAALETQLKKWASYGTIEPSCADAIAWAAKAGKQLDLSDKYFVLLGAGAAMGPLQVLLSHGANIIAIDLDRPAIWQRLLTLAQKSTGTMYFPLKSTPKGDSIEALAQVAGGNLFTDTPELCNFVASVLPGKTLTIGGYAYLDSAAHVQVSLYMYAIMKTAIERRGAANVKLGFLCSPTDVFATEPATFDAARKNRASAPLWQKAMAALLPSSLRPNGIASKSADGKPVHINDGIVVAQGPNYAFAKRIQHWRAVKAFSQGSVVSTNIAPSTSTLSVVSNASFKAAYGGMHLFKPMEVMHQETSNAVMGALLLHDTLNADSPKNPGSKAGAALRDSNPMLLFAQGAFHGGVWRIGYAMNCIGPYSAVAFYLKQYAYVPVALVAAGAYLAVKGLPFALP
jgi:opacity protein-like surface antigen